MNIISLLPLSSEFRNNDDETIEWDCTSKAFVICDQQWGTFMNRKHHCRHCKRLVCESCSTKRLILDSSNGLWKRVCDGCYTMLTTKQHVQKQYSMKRDKDELIQKSTSYISSSLIKVFYLNGSHKTVPFDSSTSIGDLAKMLCFSIKIAIFEVKDDINNHSFRLLPQSYFLAFFFLFGFPGLAAYRVHLGNEKRSKGTKDKERKDKE